MKRLNVFSRILFLALAAVMIAGGAAWADEVVIARKGEPASIDPHFSRVGPNQHTAMHVFDNLMRTDENMRLQPGLAESYRWVDDVTLEFKLRQGVKFHDGSDFTAADVVFSMERAPDVPNSPASFKRSVAMIEAMEVVDDYTIRFKAKSPYPLFPSDLSRIYIVSKKVAENATTEDFNTGQAAIGTGPYKFVEWVPGEHVIFVRNDDYWGEPQPWEKVTFRFISNDAARLAALLSGDVALIDTVPPSDIGHLRTNDKVKLWETAASRMLYLHMDSDRDQTPFITDNDGNPLDKNPLLDRRVRLALSKLINREALVERIFSGSAEPAGQMVPEGLFGYNPDLKPEAYDPEGAKALLAEAGYPDGFTVTVHGPNNRYIYDAKVVETVAQFLAKGGIDVKVQTMPKNVFFSRAGAQEFSLFLVGIGNSEGDAMASLNLLLATHDEEAGMGGSNRGRYSNPEFDAVLKKAMVELDEDKRQELLEEAAEIAFGDVGIIPLYYEYASWATLPGYKYIPRRDGRTIAMSLVPDK